MIDQSLSTEQQSDSVNIPDYLVRETIDGIPFYYRGYEAVLKNQKTLEDIMGSSGLQSYLITRIFKFLLLNLNDKQYEVLTNELGLHLSNRNNLSSDIAVYEKKQLKGKLNNKYLKIPPLIAFEIDTKIESKNTKDQEYVHLKTEKLLEFGVQKVIWVFTTSKKIMVAEPQKDWLTKNWDQTFEVLGAKSSIQYLIDDDELL